eukprot:56384-Hanusia_phi.AAC.5
MHAAGLTKEEWMISLVGDSWRQEEEEERGEERRRKRSAVEIVGGGGGGEERDPRGEENRWSYTSYNWEEEDNQKLDLSLRNSFLLFPCDPLAEQEKKQEAEKGSEKKRIGRRKMPEDLATHRSQILRDII